MRGISLVAENLSVSQEGLCSTELVLPQLLCRGIYKDVYLLRNVSAGNITRSSRAT